MKYRRYGPARVAILDGGALTVERKAGRLANLESQLDACGVLKSGCVC
jgi:glucosamine--fructose-6-phosphate aminotransferase (isomerizing)